MNTIVSLTEAYHFAAVRHVDQRRKGEALEPYINHLTEVAHLVAQATDGADLDVVIAAVLHDTIEDTGTDPEELAVLFGRRVADLVAEVTDDKALPAAERKRLQIHHAATASQPVKLIKLADKTANVRSLANSPPPDWPTQRRLGYIAWARQVVEGCRGASARLEGEFDRAVAQAAASLEDR